MKQVVTASEAAKIIQNGSTVCVGGFVGCMHPEALTSAIEKNFLNTGEPNNITLVYAAGQGDGKERGLNHFGHDGLICRAIGGHWALAPKLQKLALENKIEAYNFPQGVISHLMRDIAAGKPGTITHVGLNTFVDPRLEGGKLNEKTKDDLVKVVNIEEKDYLLYKAFPIDIALVRATYSDIDGNATFENECVSLETLAICQAVKNSGGKVILQVENIVEKGTLNTQLIKLPGIYVDAIVVAKPEEHMQTFSTQFNASFSGKIKIPNSSLQALELDVRKIIARRCVKELIPNSVINLGIGIPEGIASVAVEENIMGNVTLTVESGVIGGIPASGQDFGASINPDCIIDEPSQFDFYNGGGLDAAFLGLAQADQFGNVNVSKFGPKIAGCGGFIDITQNAKKLVYCGTFTAGGLKVEVKNNSMRIVQEGRSNKFLLNVEQITFSGSYALMKGQPVLYITERAVFELTQEGLMLTEIAPGIDLEKDILAHMEFEPIISKELKYMDEKLFSLDKVGIKI